MECFHGGELWNERRPLLFLESERCEASKTCSNSDPFNLSALGYTQTFQSFNRLAHSLTSTHSLFRCLIPFSSPPLSIAYPSCVPPLFSLLLLLFSPRSQPPSMSPNPLLALFVQLAPHVRWRGTTMAMRLRLLRSVRARLTSALVASKRRPASRICLRQPTLAKRHSSATLSTHPLERVETCGSSSSLAWRTRIPPTRSSLSPRSPPSSPLLA